MTEEKKEGPRRRYGLDDEIKGRGKAVLVVDDSGMMRLMVCDAVRELGFDPVEAATGEEATALADYYEPRLMVLDIQMPGTSGLQALERMRANPKLLKTPVIMLTVETHREAIQTAIGLGALDYLVKPVTATVLKERMQLLLDRTD